MRHGSITAVPGRDQIVAAVFLVADGRSPRVIVSNIPDAMSLAVELTPLAARDGVRLDVLGRGPDCHAVQVRLR